MGRTVLPEIMEDRFKELEYPKIEEGKLTKYNWMVQNKEGLKLGYKTDIGAFTYINAKNGVLIEDFVQIGFHCYLYPISTIDNKEGKITLKKNCKIGSHSVIIPGVTIGKMGLLEPLVLLMEMCLIMWWLWVYRLR